MRCPKCGNENKDSAKFCKKCGTALKEGVVTQNVVKSQNQSNNTTKIIIVALIIVAVVIAGVLVYSFGFTSNPAQEQNTTDNQSDVNLTSEEPKQAQSTNTQEVSTTPSSMTIYGGSFNTGSGLSDKTYASIYVGPEHAGEKVKIQIFYSRDGSDLNNGNIVPKTVDSSGYINVRSAQAYKYFPDFATINLYDTSGNLLDTQSVSLSPESGTQSF